MKKTFLSLLCLAAAAMTFTACSDVDDFEPNRVNNKVVFVAENPGVEEITRSHFEIDSSGNIQTLWSAYPKDTENSSDVIYAYFENMDEGKSYGFKSDIKVNSEKAGFVDADNIKSTLIADMEANGATELYFLTQKMTEEGYDYILNIGENQYLRDYNTIDGRADVLVSNKVTKDELKNATEPIKLKFKRLNGIIRVNLKPGDGVTWDDISGFKSIFLDRFHSTSDDINFGGNYTVDFAKGEISCNYYNPVGLMYNESEIQVDPTIRGNVICFPQENIPAYIVSLPVTIKKGETLSVFIKKPGNTIFKTWDLTEDVVVEAGKITTFNITINKDEFGKTPFS